MLVLPSLKPPFLSLSQPFPCLYGLFSHMRPASCALSPLRPVDDEECGDVDIMGVVGYDSHYVALVDRPMPPPRGPGNSLMAPAYPRVRVIRVHLDARYPVTLWVSLLVAHDLRQDGAVVNGGHPGRPAPLIDEDGGGALLQRIMGCVAAVAHGAFRCPVGPTTGSLPE